MQDRRVEVVDADRSFRHLHSIVVGLSRHHGLFDTRAGQPTTEGPCMMTRILDVSHVKLILHEHRPQGVDQDEQSHLHERLRSALY